jgi:prophage regulatory protein
MSERLIRIPEVMSKLGIGRSTVWQYVKENKMPKPSKLSPKVTVWRETEIQAYILHITSVV